MSWIEPYTKAANPKSDFVEDFVNGILFKSSKGFLLCLNPKTMKTMLVLCISYDSEASGHPPAHFQNHENDDGPCISYDSDASRFHPAHSQNHENDDSPMHCVWFAPLPPISKYMKMITVLCISFMILKPTAPLPPTSKTRKW